MADVNTFLMSMAVVIAMAAVIIILFNRFRQPLILGYLVAGMLVGPFVTDAEESIELLASLGIILLTFSIGLEFNFKKLRKIGIGVITAATLEIIMMIFIGFQLGLALGWTTLEATLLGAILSIASTMIIIRSLKDSWGLDSERARLIVGLLIVEDFAAVLILAAVSGLMSPGGIDTEQLGWLILSMVVFVAASILIGIAAIPRLIDYVGRQRSGELLILTVLGLCFSMAYIARYIGLSEAIGAFVMGVIVSESRFIGDVIRKVEPVRDLFGAIFFITVGMLVDISLFSDFGAFVIPVLIITAVFVAAKMFSCSFSTFLTGFGIKNAIGAGLGMVAIGEFSLMIARVAESSGNVRPGIYEIIVVVTTITALIVPYTVMSTNRVTRAVEGRMPRSLVILASYLNLIITNLRRRSKSSVRISNEMRRNISALIGGILGVIITVALALWFAPMVPDYAYLVGGNEDLLTLPLVVVTVLLAYLALRSIYHRTIRLVEVSTSEAMLSTRSAEFVGYTATSNAFKWLLLSVYVVVGFIVFSPIVISMVHEDLVYVAFALVIVVMIVIALRSSVRSIDSGLTEALEGSGAPEAAETSRDLVEIEEIIAEMERERR
ncbi:MAG: cation:proton antiporter [Thermoplasmata archaeon]|jgi:CPA2 family monovalent cation:H+ antiporter-2|nr:cation:proton antiporter [Thermoplasmata archaeon]